MKCPALAQAQGNCLWKACCPGSFLQEMLMAIVVTLMFADCRLVKFPASCPFAVPLSGASGPCAALTDI